MIVSAPRDTRFPYCRRRPSKGAAGILLCAGQSDEWRVNAAFQSRSGGFGDDHTNGETSSCGSPFRGADVPSRPPSDVGSRPAGGVPQQDAAGLLFGPPPSKPGATKFRRSHAAMDLTETDANPAPPGGRVDAIMTSDGIRLRCAHWQASTAKPKGTVLILQGRTEFIEKYFETIADLMKRGFAVVTFDWRSQGRSQRLAERCCHIESFADYDRDFDAVMRQVVLPDCPQPLFALAHSMGALATLRAARDGRARFDRMVLMAPMLELSRRSAPPMGVIRFASGLGLFFARDSRPVSNRALRERYESDEGQRQERIDEVQRVAPDLWTGLPSTRWVHASAQAMREVETMEFAQAVKQPVLLVACGRDRVVSNEAIERFAGELRFAAQIIVAGARHEVLMEPDPVREQFWAAFDAFVPGGDPFAIASGSGKPG